MADGVVVPTEEGTPQGGPLSPLLANVMLDELDRGLERRDHAFVRYADDCIILKGSRRAAERTMQAMTKFIEGRLFLKVNCDKSFVARIDQGVKYLGYGFYFGKGDAPSRPPQVRRQAQGQGLPHPRALQRMVARLQALPPQMPRQRVGGLLQARRHVNVARGGGRVVPPQGQVRLLEVMEEAANQVQGARAPRRPEREGARVGEHAQVVLARGGELDSRPCARQRQARRTGMMLLPEALPRCDVVRLGTAVYRTVCTVVWEDGTPTNDVPPTRFGKRAAASRPACRGGKPRRHIGSMALLPHAGNFSRSSSFLRSSHSLPYLWRISPILVLPRLQWQSSSAWRQYQRAFERL